ncbi:MAG: GNAT family N-acetyltransferase [Deltaproteobacteria bacterium]|nr:GNAT family N-acetyltransferase [Deltaproteobacteria bacterium]
MDSIVIRRLKEEDAKKISAIYASITNETDKKDFEAAIKEQAISRNSLAFVAEIEKQVVGFMICYILTGVFGLKKSAWIADMGVDPKCMGKGIGRKLAENIFEYCKKKEICDIYSSVQWDSTDLLSFFKTLGFGRSNFINLTKKL